MEIVEAFVNTLRAIIFGLIQGLTEFIPVSSSGHLQVAQEYLGTFADGTHIFLQLVNFGTLLALLIYYRKRILEILKEIFVKHNFKFALNIIITCIPVCTVGLLLSSFIENTPLFSNLYIVMTAMIVVGILMVKVENLPKMKHIKDDKHLNWKQALGIGVAQCFALIPGASRSGTTILAGRVAGLDNKSAADYSFTVSIVVMAGVMLKSLISSSSRAYIADNWQLVLLSNAVAFISGMFAIRFVMKYLKKKGSLEAFGKYRIIFAIFVLIFCLIK